MGAGDDSKDQYVGILTCSTVGSRRRLPVTMNRAVYFSLVLIQTLVSLAATFPVGKTSPGPSVQTQYGLVQGLMHIGLILGLI